MGVNEGVCGIDSLQFRRGWIWPGLWVSDPGRVQLVSSIPWPPLLLQDLYALQGCSCMSED